jgi:MOSC domain-containing protein YiiM
VTVQRLRSLQVGQPRDLGTVGAADGMPRPWRSGFHKEPVTGPRWLARTNLEGDGQADLRVHGGPDKAVCVYPTARYPYWERDLGVPSLPPGAFGENFSVDGVVESDVCVGDVCRVGDAVVQVSQPRGPCWKLARRWGVRDLAVRFQRTGFTGWYLRVLAEGSVQAGQPLVLVERPHPEWTVARANQVNYHERDDRHAAGELAGCAALGRSWRDKLAARAAAGGRAGADDDDRLHGAGGW